MKKILLIALTAMFLSGCTEKTEFGMCVGAFEDREPGLVYKLDVWNTVLAVIFVETIIVPVVVIANQTVCPVAKKETK